MMTLAIFVIGISRQAHAAVQLPDSLRGSTPLACGELAAPGTYSLTSSVSTSTGACFTITSNNVVLTSSTTGSYKVTGDIVGNGINPGDPGFNFTIENLVVTGTTSSNGADTGTIGSSYTAGDGGTIVISTSTVSAVLTNGGNSQESSYGIGGSGGAVTMIDSTSTSIQSNAGGIGPSTYFAGGNGGTIVITNTDLDASNMNISAYGSAGNFGTGTNGTLTMNYSTFEHANLVLSALSDLTLNGPSNQPGDLGAFTGGVLSVVSGDTITNASQCNLILAGTYTLGADLTGDCTISANGVVLDGAEHTINGNIMGDGIATGTTGYNFTIENITVTGTTSSDGGDGANGGSVTIATSTVNIVDSNGNDGGSGGTISIASSTVNIVDANGGNTLGSQGNGGSVTISGTDLSWSSTTVSALGGTGNNGMYIGRGMDGTLTLNYSTIEYSGLSLSALSDIVLNGPGGSPGNSGAFGGGSLGTFPGDHITNASQCELGFSGTYTIDNDFTGNCVITATSSVVINGGGHTITGNVIGDGIYRGDWGHDFTIDDLNVTGTTSSNGADYGSDYNGAIDAGGIITIIKDHIVLADEHLSLNGGDGIYGRSSSGGLILDYDTIDLTNGTFPDVMGGYPDHTSPYVVGLTMNGPGNLPGALGPMTGGGFSNPGDLITDPSMCHIMASGTYTLAADLGGNCYIKSNGVVLNGNGHSIIAGPSILGMAPTGNIIADGYTGNGYDFTLENVTVAGAITSIGIESSYGGADGDGGHVTMTDSTTTSGVIFLSGNNHGGAVDITGTTIGLSDANINVGGTVNGGDIIISGTDVDLSNATISVSGGTANGTLTIDYTTLKDSGITVGGLSDLTLNGPNDLPGDLGAFSGGTLGALPGDTLTKISQCDNLSVAGTYTLGADLTGDCTIVGNGIIINGAGHVLNGGIYGNGAKSGASGYDFSIENVIVTGTTSSNGFIGPFNSFPWNGGTYHGGNITISSSTVATTTANGGTVGPGFTSDFKYLLEGGGNGGSIILSSSTATLVEANGGSFPTNFSIASSSRASFLSIIGSIYNSNINPAGTGGNGGTITIATSTTGAILSDGGSIAFGGNAGNGGTIRVTNSFADPSGSIISANGGSIALCGYGGSGGSIVLSDSTYGTTTVDKGDDVETTIADGGYCQNQTSSLPLSPILSVTGSNVSSSGSVGLVQNVGQYNPPQTPQLPATSPVTVKNNPVAVNANISVAPSSFSGSGSSVVASSTSQTAVQTTETHGRSFVSFASSIGSAANVALKKVSDTAVAVANSPESKPVQTVGFIAGLMASVATYAETGTAAPLAAEEIFLLPIRMWGIALVSFGIRKRGRPWGTVYDSVTKQPIDPAFISVKDTTGRVVAESITDLDGRYGFLLPDGTYYISVKKTNYEFPSQKMIGKSSDELYNDLYFGDPVTVRSGEVLDKNIPMDQKNFDWNEQAKRERNLMLFHSKNERIWAIISKYVYGVGLAVSVIVVMAKPSPFDVSMLISYTLILVFLEFGIKKKELGSILDKNTGEPLSYAIFRATTPDHQVVLRSGVCDAKGRYYCIVPKGEYCMNIDKKNQDGSYSRVYESQKMSSNSGIVNKNFIV